MIKSLAPLAAEQLQFDSARSLFIYLFILFITLFNVGTLK